MSAMIRLRGFTAPQKIFIWYNFKQVKDAVLLILYVEKKYTYERIFIYKNAERWETDILRSYVDDKTYYEICNRLKYLLDVRDDYSEFGGLDLEKAVQNYSDFLVGPD